MEIPRLLLNLERIATLGEGFKVAIQADCAP